MEIKCDSCDNKANVKVNHDDYRNLCYKCYNIHRCEVNAKANSWWSNIFKNWGHFNTLILTLMRENFLDRKNVNKSLFKFTCTSCKRDIYSPIPYDKFLEFNKVITISEYGDKTEINYVKIKERDRPTLCGSCLHKMIKSGEFILVEDAK